MADRRIYSFSEIVNKVITTIGVLGSSLTDFGQGSNLRAIVDSLAHFIEFTQLQINVAMEAFTVRGAKGADLDNRIQDFAITRKQSIPSYGVVKFLRTTPAPSAFTIYADSQVSTQPDVYGNTIDYTTDEDITFASGAMSATGYVTCVVAGSIGNVPSGYITNMTSTIPGVDSITNEAAFTPGADAETDEQLRERLPKHINGLKSGNEDAIIAAALSVDGITVSRVEENYPTAGTVTVYVSNQFGAPTREQIDAVKDAVDSEAAFGITTSIVTPILVYITISADVTYDGDNYDEVLLNEKIKTAIFNTILNNTGDTLKLVDLYVLIREIPGVNNVKNVKIDGVADDYTSNGFDVVRLADKYTSTTINYTAE